MDAVWKGGPANNGAGLGDIDTLLLVFVDGGSGWLINLSDVAVSDVAVYVCDGAVEWELESFSAERLAPFEQLRCPPLDVPGVDGEVTIEVDWTVDDERLTDSYRLRPDGELKREET